MGNDLITKAHEKKKCMLYSTMRCSKKSTSLRLQEQLIIKKNKKKTLSNILLGYIQKVMTRNFVYNSTYTRKLNRVVVSTQKVEYQD